MDPIDENKDPIDKTMDRLANFYEKRADRILENALQKESGGGCLGTLRNAFQLALLNLFVVAMAAGTLWFGWRGYNLAANGDKTLGTVIAMTEQDDSEGGCCTYSPVIEYQVDGQTYQFESMNASDPPRFKVGEEVEIAYLLEDPNKGEINSWTDIWMVPVLLGASTVLVAVVLNGFAIAKMLRGEPILEED